MNEEGRRLSRRAVLGAFVGGLGLGGLGASAWWSSRDHGGTTLDLGDAQEILREIIRTAGPVPVDDDRTPDNFPPLVVAAWEPQAPVDNERLGDQRVEGVYGATGEDHPIVDGEGLMVIIGLSTHRHCVTPFCASSGWFEDPCFGSKFNRYGEWTGGPAPRGLDRLQSRVEDGRLVADALTLVPGRPRELFTLRDDPIGPNCAQL